MLAEFIKNEFTGFSKKELIGAGVLLLSVLLISVSVHDSKIATAQALFSLSYSVMAGKGKISCYFFGILGTLCYSFLSFKNAIYGAVMLQMGYFLPMEIIGIFMWKKKMNHEKQSIIKTKLTNKERLYFGFLIILISFAVALFLAHIGDRFPFMDAFSTVFSVFAMYFTVRRCIEQWALWTGVNILSAIMWLMIFIGGEHTFATFLTWSIHLFLGIYFMFEWHKELKTQAQ